MMRRSAGVPKTTTMPLRRHAVLLALTALVFAPSPQAADASSPPTAYTGNAAQVTTSSATLEGSVYAGNQQTSYYFQYGPTTAYGAQTPTASVDAGTQTEHVSALIATLSVDTVYHYRLVAVNASATKEGPDRTFTTKKIPLTLQVQATPSRDLFGSPFLVQGTLSGTGSANHPVVVEANPFPYLAGFKPIISPVLTNAGGSFSISVAHLSANTQLRVSTLETPAVNSRVLVELVQVRVTLHLRRTARRGYARLYGTITPAQTGAVVGLQLLRPGRKPLGLGSTLATQGRGSFSRFSRVVHIPRGGFYRAHVIVASGAQVSNYSRTILIR